MGLKALAGGEGDFGGSRVFLSVGVKLFQGCCCCCCSCRLGDGVPVVMGLLVGANSMTLLNFGSSSKAVGEVGEGVNEAEVRYGCGDGVGSGEQGKPFGELMGMKCPSFRPGVMLPGVEGSGTGEGPRTDEEGAGEGDTKASRASSSERRLAGKGGGVGAGVPYGEKPMVSDSHSLVTDCRWVGCW